MTFFNQIKEQFFHEIFLKNLNQRPLEIAIDMKNIDIIQLLLDHKEININIFINEITFYYFE